MASSAFDQQSSKTCMESKKLEPTFSRLLSGQNLTKYAKLQPLLTMSSHSVFVLTDYD